MMELAAIVSHLPPTYPWHAAVTLVKSIDSTNDALKRLAVQGAPEGTALIAECQTRGKGRRGRSFCSPAGLGIYMSVLLRPHCPAGQLLHLTPAIGEAICDAVERSTDIRPNIKWANDLVIERRKICGILVEPHIDALGNVESAVCGIGINCCQRAEDFPPELRETAASLAMFTPQVNQNRLAAEMLAAMRQISETVLREKCAWMRRYRADCMTIGQEISLVRGNQNRHGTALDEDDDGALLVRYTGGETEAVCSGEVSVRGMYGYV